MFVAARAVGRICTGRTCVIKAGDKIPAVTFHTRQDLGAGDEWVDVTTAELFDGRTVVLFALPGAFTPICSSTHLPGFAAQSAAIRAEGVDGIYCLSVNDAFVMNAWAKHQKIQGEVTMLPDGNAEFTSAAGMLVDKSNIGLRRRSWRYAAVIVDGVVERLFIEDMSHLDDPFEVSDAGTVLAYLRARREKAEASGGA